MALIRREHPSQSPTPAPASAEPFGSIDRLFDEWLRVLPVRWTGWSAADAGGVLRVDEIRRGDEVVVRAEMAGVDPSKDVAITVDNGVLEIAVERRAEETEEEEGFVRRELRYGSFRRSLALPEGTSEADITATYKDGILEVHVPMPAGQAAAEPKRIPVQTS
jgi:HSP20 family protein